MGTKEHLVHFATAWDALDRTATSMPHRYNAEARQALMRLKASALQSQIAAEDSHRFLRNANLDEQTRRRFRQRAEEARLLSMQVSDALTQHLLLELAEGFDSLAR